MNSTLNDFTSSLVLWVILLMPEICGGIDGFVQLAYSKKISARTIKLYIIHNLKFHQKEKLQNKITHVPPPSITINEDVPFVLF